MASDSTSGGLISSSSERLERLAQLADAAVDQQDVGKHIAVVAELAESPGDHFADARVVVDALDVANAKPPIARLERQAIEKLHQAGDRFVAAQVGDVDAFDVSRPVFELEDFLQAGEPLLRIDVRTPRAARALSSSPRSRRLSSMSISSRSRAACSNFSSAEAACHFRPHLVEQLLAIAFQKHPQPLDVVAVLLLADPQDCTGPCTG